MTANLTPGTDTSKQLWREALAVAAVVILGAAVGISRATSIFDPFDYSGFLDLYYRVYSGQKLYADFFYNAGPGHAYLGTFFYWLIGPGANAVKANVCALSLFMGVYSYTLARSSFGMLASMPLAALATLYFVGPFSFPSYDHHAWLFLLLAVAGLRVKFSKGAVPDASLRGAFCGTLIALSVLTKANIGAIGGVVVTAILLLLPEKKRALLWLGISFVLAINLVFFLLGTPFEFFQTNVVEFAPGSRLTGWNWLLDVVHDIPYTFLAAGLIALALVGGRDFIKRERRDLAILGGLICASVFSVWTASMNRDINTFLLGLEVVFLFVLVRRLPQGTPQSAEQRIYRASTILLILVCVLASITGVERTWRLGFFTTRLPLLNVSTYKIKSPLFKDWLCKPVDCEGMDDLVEYMHAKVPKQDSLFVFPDMQVIYQLTGHQSYLHAPYQFVLDMVPGPGKPTAVFLNHFDENPPKWVVIHTVSFLPVFGLDTTLQLKSLQLDQYLWKNYTRAWSGKLYTLLKHN